MPFAGTKPTCLQWHLVVCISKINLYSFSYIFSFEQYLKSGFLKLKQSESVSNLALKIIEIVLEGLFSWESSQKNLDFRAEARSLPGKEYIADSLYVTYTYELSQI